MGKLSTEDSSQLEEVDSELDLTPGPALCLLPTPCQEGGK